jgi:hypothetical protein
MQRIILLMLVLFIVLRLMECWGDLAVRYRHAQQDGQLSRELFSEHSSSAAKKYGVSNGFHLNTPINANYTQCNG